MNKTVKMQKMLKILTCCAAAKSLKVRNPSLTSTSGHFEHGRTQESSGHGKYQEFHAKTMQKKTAAGGKSTETQLKYTRFYLVLPPLHRLRTCKRVQKRWASASCFPWHRGACFMACLMAVETAPLLKLPSSIGWELPISSRWIIGKSLGALSSWDWQVVNRSQRFNVFLLKKTKWNITLL